jgi:drug/metabolite transporter (DMT)-like permease
MAERTLVSRSGQVPGDNGGMLAIVLALAAAIVYGGSDFTAGLAARGASVIQVTLIAAVVAAAVAVAAVPFAATEHRPAAAALAWGVLAGVAGTAGAFALYLGFKHAAFSVAGPLSAVGAAGFSVLAGLLMGERPTALALAGTVLALPAIVSVSASAVRGDQADGHGQPTAGVVLGLIAGACFALLFIGLNRAGTGSGLWPVAACGVADVVVAGVAAAVTGNLRLPGVRAGWLAAAAGATGAAGTIFYFFATHDGFLAVTAVLTSLYPAVTIVLARIALGERLTRLRVTGLALAAACVALIAAGGAG